MAGGRIGGGRLDDGKIEEVEATRGETDGKIRGGEIEVTSAASAAEDDADDDDNALDSDAYSFLE